MAAGGFVIVGDPDDCAKGVQQWVDDRLRPADLQPHHQHAAHRGGRAVDGAVRPRGHPAVRQGPGALHHPVPRGGGARPRRLNDAALLGTLTECQEPGQTARAAVVQLRRPLGGGVADVSPIARPWSCGDQRRTYAELAERVNQLAHHLAVGRARAGRARRPLHAEPRRVARGDARRVQDPGRPDQPQLPLHGGELRYAARERRRAGAVVYDERDAAAEVEPVGRRQLGARARACRRATTSRPRWPRQSAEPLDDRAQRRRPLRDLHRRHHRHAQGRGVAPGGRVLRLPRRRRPDAPRRGRSSSPRRSLDRIVAGA